MAPKRGLGKGLDSLIPNSVLKPATPEKLAEENKVSVKSEEKAAETLVKITKIEPNREQPRKNFDEEALNELAESIKHYGLISPILVQDKKDHYEIIAGERRWRAAKIAGLKEVPVIIREYTEREIAEIALIENVQREDLNPIEEAMGYKRLIEEFDLKQEEVAECVSKSRSAITNSLRLLKLSEEVQKYLVDGELSMGHARALLAVEDSEKQTFLAKKIINEKLSVREVEKLVKNLDKPVKEKPSPDTQLQAIYESYEEKIKQSLATKVKILPSVKTKGAGRFEIEFYSTEDFERILERIMRE
ncbi:MAG: ParB/RepB/Spo0J family partition protein [Lachnospiraceae bacterium]|nr:ParB/RepB/Spo0J family partition protein [Lachnospiraceae bacterium]